MDVGFLNVKGIVRLLGIGFQSIMNEFIHSLIAGWNFVEELLDQQTIVQKENEKPYAHEA